MSDNTKEPQEHHVLKLEPARFTLSLGSVEFTVKPALLANLETPALMQQSVVTLGEKTNEGYVIEAVSI